ncbi:MAG TPA: TadE family protein [Allosphingosinicella sp.]|jgi:Flp pilus assembly pilin Flp
MMLKSSLRRDQKGIGAVEFALIAPAFIAMIVGVSQMGKLFFANADMKNAAAAGARAASVWPIPDDAAILAAVNGRLAASNASDRAVPTVVRGTDANGNNFIDISMSYTVPLEFVFFDMPPITLTDKRRVFTQVTQANATTYTTTTSGSNGGGSSNSAGGTSSATSASSAGGTGSTSTSTSTSASTSASTSTTSASTSSGDNNGSSGDNNGSSGNGHGHGNCNKKC